LIWFQKLSTKQFENRSRFKRCSKFASRKTKILLFNQQSVFKTKDLLARFCFKRFDFTSRAKTLSKINFAFKMVCKLLNKILMKRFLSSTFQKKGELTKLKWAFQKSSFQSDALKKGFLKPSLIAKALPCKMRSDFKSFLKLVLFDSNKREATLCFENQTKFSKSFYLKPFKKESVWF